MARSRRRVTESWPKVSQPKALCQGWADGMLLDSQSAWIQLPGWKKSHMQWATSLAKGVKILEHH